MSTLPICQTLLLERHNGVLHITLNRPDSRNAMSLQMVADHQRANLPVIAHRRQHRTQLGDHLQAHGVATVGAIEGDV